MPLWLCLPAPSRQASPPFCSQVVTLLVCLGVGTFKQPALYGMLEDDHWDKAVCHRKKKERERERNDGDGVGLRGLGIFEQEEC